jgi:hypothetical protein
VRLLSEARHALDARSHREALQALPVGRVFAEDLVKLHEPRRNVRINRIDLRELEA